MSNKPYRLLNEFKNNGLFIPSSKTTNTWKFGLDDNEIEYKVTVKFSKFSGKLVIYEDENQILKNKKVTKDFSYEWNSGNNLFKIELDPPLFYINGISFDDFKTKDEVKLEIEMGEKNGYGSINYDNATEIIENEEDKYNSGFDKWFDTGFLNFEETTYDDEEPLTPEALQAYSLPNPICFVFKVAGTASKALKKKTKPNKAKADKKDAKEKEKKKKQIEVEVKDRYEPDPNLSDVENFIASIEEYEQCGQVDDESRLQDVLIFKSTDLSIKIPDFKCFSKIKCDPSAWFSSAQNAITKAQSTSMEGVMGKYFDKLEAGDLDDSNDLENLTPEEYEKLGIGEKFMPQTVTKEYLNFVVIYPYVEVVQEVAELDGMSILLDSQKLNAKHESFAEKYSTNPKIINMKRLGCSEMEWNKFYEDPDFNEYFKKYNPQKKQLSDEEYDNLPLEQKINDIPYRNIYADYTINQNDSTYEVMTPFTPIINYKLTSQILEEFDECYYDYDNYVTHFILHDEKELKRFTNHISFWNYPISRIRNYFGEQIAFYFAFTSHYTTWIGVLGVVSLITQIYILLAQDNGGAVVSTFSIFVIIWATLMMNLWIMYQSRLALNWGMLDFESKEKVRPSFQDQGDEFAKNEKEIMTTDPTFVRGRRFWYSDILDVLVGGVNRTVSPTDRYKFDYVYVNMTNKRLRLSFSMFIMLVLEALMISSTAGVYILQGIIENTSEELGPYSKYIATALNVAQSLFFEFIYVSSKEALNEFENHKTQTDYEDSIIRKNAIFTFTNSLVSFYYLAFVAGKNLAVLFGYPPEDGCAGYKNCMEALMFNLGSVLIINLIIQSKNHLCDILSLSYLRQIFDEWWLGEYSNPKVFLNKDHPHIQFIDQYFQYDSNGPEASFSGELNDNYTEHFKQFGLLILFLPALPISAFICFLTNWVKMNGDMKSFATSLRTLPIGAQDIGAWESCFQALILIAIPTNSAIIIFTMNSFDDSIHDLINTASWPEEYFLLYKLLLFCVMQYIILIIVFGINNLVPNEVPEIKVNQDRTQVILSNLTLMDTIVLKENLEKAKPIKEADADADANGE